MGRTINIHWTDNMACRSRGCDMDTIYDSTITYTDVTDLFNQLIDLMDLSYCFSEEEFDNEEDIWNWFDEEDIGFGDPVIFYVTDKDGMYIYESGLDESDWGDADEEI